MAEENEQLEKESQDNAAQAEQDGEFVAPDMSYEEYLKLTNPNKSEEEIAKMVRKENRYTWLGRFQIFSFIVILILVLVLVFTK